MSQTIWLYWEGARPAYIELCYRTILAHNQRVTLLDRDGFEALFTHDRDIDIDSLSLNHKSDFIRAYLLKHYGGLYIDADCVVMRNLDPVIELAERYGFAGYREPQGYMSCNFMASAPGGTVMNEHYAAVCATLRRKQPLEWLDLASTLMDQAVARYPNDCALLPTELIMPISWSESVQFCIRRDDAEHQRHLRADAYCYMLSNNTIKSQHQTRLLTLLPESDLLGEHYFVSFLFRTSLGYPPRAMSAVPSYLGGHEDKTQFDEGAFDYLAERFNVRTMVDVGCGPGGMVYYARSKGIRAIGVDGDPSLAHDSPVMIEHDYTHKPLYLGEFDLGWSVEFVEHVEERYVPHFMATFSGCRHVFITAASPGQSGHHHVNCQWGDYWIAVFERAGFRFDQEATDGVRRSSTMWSRFTEHTGLVFSRIE